MAVVYEVTRAFITGLGLASKQVVGRYTQVEDVKDALLGGASHDLDVYSVVAREDADRGRVLYEVKAREWLRNHIDSRGEASPHSGVLYEVRQMRLRDNACANRVFLSRPIGVSHSREKKVKDTLLHLGRERLADTIVFEWELDGKGQRKRLAHFCDGLTWLRQRNWL